MRGHFKSIAIELGCIQVSTRIFLYDHISFIILTSVEVQSISSASSGSWRFIFHDKTFSTHPTRSLIELSNNITYINFCDFFLTQLISNNLSQFFSESPYQTSNSNHFTWSALFVQAFLPSFISEITFLSCCLKTFRTSRLR